MSTSTYDWQPSTLTLCFQVSTGVTTSSDTQHIVLHRKENSLTFTTNPFQEVETVEQSSIAAEQQTCEEHSTHILQQQMEACHTTTKMIHLQLGTSCLSTERRSHAVERRLERDSDFKFHYYNIMKHDHMEPVTSQQGSIHVTLHHTIQTSRKQFPQQDYSCVIWRC